MKDDAERCRRAASLLRNCHDEMPKTVVPMLEQMADLLAYEGAGQGGGHAE